jgi:hypothetical protein
MGPPTCSRLRPLAGWPLFFKLEMEKAKSLREIA